MPPQAILFDMDDTLISSFKGSPRDVWRRTLDEFHAELGHAALDATADALYAAALEFWSDVSRHKQARLDLVRTRREISGLGLRRVGVEDETLAHRIGDALNVLRGREMTLFPHAHEILDHLRAAGVRLALVTNGAHEPQWEKIRRFDLAHRFDHIQVEGDVGFGKPEPEAYFHALHALGADTNTAWMVGDNLEWEVAAPKRLGIHTVWHDHTGNGLPDNAPAQPDRIIRRLAELIEGF
ncbi:MAG TPA: HAD family hydrolase [Alphaproteobacteria bacterium]|nr:HAD family hydrolase [Alphaproteobacteria bacterium]